MTDLKARFPQIKYVEAFNKADNNLAKAIAPEDLCDCYEVTGGSEMPSKFRFTAILWFAA